MLPVLFVIGPLTVKTLNLFLVLAFLTSGFVFWRFGREEHYREDQLFDGFLLAFFNGVVFSRLVHIAINFSDYGWSIFNWLNVLGDLGFNLPAGLVASGIFLYRFAGKQKWEQFAILDLWMPSVLFGTAVLEIGLFFNEPLKTLFATDWWFLSSHLFLSLILFILSWYARWVEFRYRTYLWYRHNHQVAQTGFVTAVSLIFLGLATLFSDFFDDFGNLSSVPLTHYITGFSLIILGLVLFILRSGIVSKYYQLKFGLVGHKNSEK